MYAKKASKELNCQKSLFTNFKIKPIYDNLKLRR